MRYRVLQFIGAPYAAVMSILFGMMILSFPVGAYIVYNSDIGAEINFEYPVGSIPGVPLPSYVGLGDIFVTCWTISLVLFAISAVGPARTFAGSLSAILARGHDDGDGAYMAQAIRWFAILVVTSLAIAALQEQFGVSITPPDAHNELIRFVGVTVAPILEEVGFRVILIGIPLYLAYSHKARLAHFASSLWHPYRNLHIYSMRRAILLVVAVSILFGLAHVLTDNSWSAGKVLQAVAAGMIIGWVYVRYGLAPAILVHWATNYFLFSYAYMVADLGDIDVVTAFEHGLMGTIEALVITAGILAVAATASRYMASRAVAADKSG